MSILPPGDDATTPAAPPPRRHLPALDRLLRDPAAAALIERYGRPALATALRAELDRLRATPATALRPADTAAGAVLAQAGERLEAAARPSLRRVFNLTGTVLHTNLGRAALPEAAIAAVGIVAAGPSNLEYDLASGARGERDDHLEPLLCALTGAAAATVVNNNAAALLLVLNTLAARRQVVISRGELIEIGGAFRLPDIITRSGCRLVEVGTTNRTHPRDYAEALGPRTGAVLKVHTSNYAIEGFTAAVGEADLAQLCRVPHVPLVVDLGSGALLDPRRYGLPHEPTPMQAIAAGADLVTFSGDKLLGGPQAGLIVGRADLIARIRRNPLKRALRVDKLTIAALGAVLGLYRDPDRLAERLPAWRALRRPLAALHDQAARLAPALAARLAGLATVESGACVSQVGSGSLPTQGVASVALVIRPVGRRGAGAALRRLAERFRALPVPVIGRIHDGALLLDLRCLEDEAGFAAQLAALRDAPGAP
ncbi:MAG: L-seryl-tRNA(Sec) selenium transferase [Rhodospirillales bacterium]|nr:L-seryl-tRNA(Sec) selenium transferase [Rhodospirillales bacterium]